MNKQVNKGKGQKWTARTILSWTSWAKMDDDNDDDDASLPLFLLSCSCSCSCWGCPPAVKSTVGNNNPQWQHCRMTTTTMTTFLPTQSIWPKRYFWTCHQCLGFLPSPIRFFEIVSLLLLSLLSPESWFARIAVVDVGINFAIYASAGRTLRPSPRIY